ncbi:MAG: energy-coupling factor transporter transmembrane component T [Halobacteria archaeon]|nr:energy-coupling factor transporter transmembrane component T [Halobacteria archaeon]
MKPRYSDDETPLHRLDARSKLLSLTLVSVGVMASVEGLVLGVAGVVMGGLLARLRPSELLKDIWIALPIMAVGSLGRWYTTGFATSGLIDGGVASARFGVVLGLAYIVSYTTPPTETRLAVEAFLRHVPFVNETDWGAMVEVAARFVPVVFDETREVREAHRARLGYRRGWTERVRSLSVPLVTRMVERADTLALAMSSRAYSEDRTSLRSLGWRRGDTALVAASVVGVVLSLSQYL